MHIARCIYNGQDVQIRVLAVEERNQDSPAYDRPKDTSVADSAEHGARSIRAIEIGRIQTGSVAPSTFRHNDISVGRLNTVARETPNHPDWYVLSRVANGFVL
jgi:hypothetical protein